MNPLILVLLFVVTVAGSTLSGLTGLAGGAVILGGLSLFYDPANALAMHGVVQGVGNATRIAFWWRSIHWNVVWRYSLLLLPGAWVGGVLFSHLNLSLMQALLGLMILAAVWMPVPQQNRFKFTLNGFVWLGLVSGFFSMLAGVVGPLLNPFFDKLGIKREEMVSTKSTCQFVLHISRISAYIGAVGIDYAQHSLELTLMMIAAVIGIFLARPLGKKISDQQLDVVLKVLLTIIGGHNLVRGLWDYITVQNHLG